METKLIKVGKEWTLITNKLAMIQFRYETHMALTDGLEPTIKYGFTMNAGEKYINSSDGVHVWGREVVSGKTNPVVVISEYVI